MQPSRDRTPSGDNCSNPSSIGSGKIVANNSSLPDLLSNPPTVVKSDQTNTNSSIEADKPSNNSNSQQQLINKKQSSTRSFLAFGFGAKDQSEVVLLL